jgi:hypothetical protein
MALLDEKWEHVPYTVHIRNAVDGQLVAIYQATPPHEVVILCSAAIAEWRLNRARALATLPEALRVLSLLSAQSPEGTGDRVVLMARDILRRAGVL